MQIQKNSDGEIVASPLTEFRALSILGMQCVLILGYSRDDQGETLQLSLSPDQCRDLANQLRNQALVLNLERATLPQ